MFVMLTHAYLKVGCHINFFLTLIHTALSTICGINLLLFYFIASFIYVCYNLICMNSAYLQIIYYRNCVSLRHFIIFYLTLI